MPFVHLRTHTEFSVVDGTLRVDDAVAAAVADGQGALAITDLSNLFGVVKFYRRARAAGVKPIVGADLWLEPVPEASRERVACELARIIDEERHTGEFALTLKATLVVGRKGRVQ